MKLNKVQQNYLPKAHPKSDEGTALQHRPQIKNGAAPQFTGLKVKDILPYQKAFAAMKSKEWLKGEAGGILITALGTGIVAPVVMGTNPLVKAPKGATEQEKQEVNNKKWYTAMRQPISAVLAVLFQLGALKPIDRILDRKFNIAENSKFVDLHLDQCEINNKTFRERLVKAQFKDAGKTKPSIFGIITKGYKKTMDARKAYKKEFEEAVENIENQQVEKVAQKFRQTGQIHIGERQLDNETLAKLVNNKIEDYVDAAKELKRTNDKITHYTGKAELIMNNKEAIIDMFKDLPADEKEAEVFIRNLSKKVTDPQLKEVINDVMNRSEDLWGSRASRTVERIDKITKICNGEYSMDNYIDAMAKRNAELDRIITKLELQKIKNPSAADTKAINETIKKVASLCRFDDNDELLRTILNKTETFDSDLNKLTKKIYTDITKGYKKLVEHEYKAFNQAAKVGIGVLVTLPITCTALNLVYPVIMDLCFPKLSGKKAAAAAKQDNAAQAAGKEDK